MDKFYLFETKGSIGVTMQQSKGDSMGTIISLTITGICISVWHYIGFIDVNSLQLVDSVIYFMVVFLYFKEFTKGD